MGIKGFTEEQLDSVSERVKNELAENGTYAMMLSIWGQKPLKV
jgi:hypothetical protein